ncbi:MAG: hypothetical protein U1F81_07730 [Verrucomicrobiaceae bacterium]
MSSSIECPICGTTNPFRFRKTESYHYSEGICSDCSSKKKRLSEWRKCLEVTVDQILQNPDVEQACNDMSRRIQAKLEVDWPNEPFYKLSLHELAFQHVYDLIGGLPGEGLRGHLNNCMGDFWQILSALKMAGFDEAYDMLHPHDGEMDPDLVDEDVLDAALPKERLLEFVRLNRGLFYWCQATTA